MSDYIVTFRGFPACPCLAKWLPWFEKVLLKRGVIKECIDITQLIGGASASAGTHSKGGAFDVWQADPVTQEVGREMGAATWNRTAAQGFKPHTHGVLTGCPHNAPAAYQIEALKDGFSGLGAGGRGSKDYGPGPRWLRTWQDGIEWAKAQTEEDMAEYSEELATIRNGVQWIVNRLKADAAIRVNLQRLLKQGKATKAELQELSDAFEAAQK